MRIAKKKSNKNDLNLLNEFFLQHENNFFYFHGFSLRKSELDHAKFAFSRLIKFYCNIEEEQFGSISQIELISNETKKECYYKIVLNSRFFNFAENYKTK